MVFNRSPDSDPGFGGALGTSDPRAAALRQAQERAAHRQTQIDAQTSPLYAPHERIRLWEKLHAVNLPRAAEHKLLHLIAEQTGLTLRQVQDEQQRRAQPQPQMQTQEAAL